MSERRTKPTHYTSSKLEQGMVPPNASDLEEAVLGAIMLEPQCFEDVTLIVKPQSFYRIEHQHIFSAMMNLYEADSVIDILTVTQQLKKNGQLDLCGGAYFVSQLTERIGAANNVKFHARIIEQKFIQRELIRVAGDIYHEAFQDTTDALELLDKANSDIAEVGSDAGTGAKSKSNQELAGEVISDAERASTGGEVVGLPSPIPEKDRMTGGYEGGKLYIVAGRPGSGKSSVALHDAYHISVILNKPVLFFSIEMTSKELMLRMISIRTGIDSKNIKNGQLTKEEWNTINGSVQAIIDSPLEIIDGISNLMEIRKKCILKKKKGELCAVFVDYIQLVQYKEKGRSPEQEISEISRIFKETSKLVDCPMIALAQLSRAVETRGGTKRPMLSDLRGSGQLEADADQVHFLYRPEYYGIEVSEETNLPTAGLTEYIIAKNRGGSTGTVPMRFNKETTSFSPWEQQSFSTATSLPTPSRSEIDEYYRSPMPRSQEFGDIDDLKEKEDEVF